MVSTIFLFTIWYSDPKWPQPFRPLAQAASRRGSLGSILEEEEPEATDLEANQKEGWTLGHWQTSDVQQVCTATPLFWPSKSEDFRKMTSLLWFFSCAYLSIKSCCQYFAGYSPESSCYTPLGILLKLFSELLTSLDPQSEIRHIPKTREINPSQKRTCPQIDPNVGIAIINHPPNHHFYGWYTPSNMGGFWHCYTHITNRCVVPDVGLQEVERYELISPGQLLDNVASWAYPIGINF